MISRFPLPVFLALVTATHVVGFDYVVIGGGAGYVHLNRDWTLPLNVHHRGLAVASRLSENPDVTVAVIEAGFNAENLPEVFRHITKLRCAEINPQVYIPGMTGSGIAFTTLDWNYPTIPQKNLNGRAVKVNAGKALGGSTVINSMIFVSDPVGNIATPEIVVSPEPKSSSTMFGRRLITTHSGDGMGCYRFSRDLKSFNLAMLSKRMSVGLVLRNLSTVLLVP
jgi:hypothetical protein